jgi:23S rRNA (uracil1939-C5)-methyltransferase
VNAAAAVLLHAHVVERTLSHHPQTVVDAYAGAGATAVALAEKGVRVTAIELDGAAARWTGARLPPSSRAVAARVEDVLDSTLPADVVIVNPPRAGVDERVTRTLQHGTSPRAIVYVSCNPATLARDVLRLPAFRIASLAAFDMFPQTAHVETVCELVREAA